mgnify:CR=1 FL=1
MRGDNLDIFHSLKTLKYKVNLTPKYLFNEHMIN